MAYPSLDKEVWVEINVLSITEPTDSRTHGKRKSKGKAAHATLVACNASANESFRHETCTRIAFNGPNIVLHNMRRCINMA